MVLCAMAKARATRVALAQDNVLVLLTSTRDGGLGPLVKSANLAPTETHAVTSARVVCTALVMDMGRARLGSTALVIARARTASRVLPVSMPAQPSMLSPVVVHSTVCAWQIPRWVPSACAILVMLAQLAIRAAQLLTVGFATAVAAALRPLTSLTLMSAGALQVGQARAALSVSVGTLGPVVISVAQVLQTWMAHGTIATPPVVVAPVTTSPPSALVLLATWVTVVT